MHTLVLLSSALVTSSVALYGLAFAYYGAVLVAESRSSIKAMFRRERLVPLLDPLGLLCAMLGFTFQTLPLSVIGVLLVMLGLVINNGRLITGHRGFEVLVAGLGGASWLLLGYLFFFLV